METKHTPGPWRYEAGTKTIRAARENYWLCSMDSFDGAVDHEANARLIAAAPELLAALMVLVDHAREAYPHFEDTRGQRDIGEALAAISKAKGE